MENYSNSQGENSVPSQGGNSVPSQGGNSVPSQGGNSASLQDEISALPILEYNGQRVLTTKQIGVHFECGTSKIRDIFRYYKMVFIEDVDYFVLEKDALRDFKAAVAVRNFRADSTRDFRFPFAKSANCLYLWTLSGFEKLSKFIATDKAKLIYSSMKFGYFNFENSQGEISALSQDEISALSQGEISALSQDEISALSQDEISALSQDEISALSQDEISAQKKLSPLDVYSELKFLIANCADENLRDELIKTAAKILIAG